MIYRNCRIRVLLVFLGFYRFEYRAFTRAGRLRDERIAGSRPIYRISEYVLHGLIMEDRISFMTGLEVEYLSESSVIAKSAAENMAVLKPACENKLIGLRDHERLTVHLFLRESKICRYPLSYRMRREHIPYDLALIVAPDKIAGRADNKLERL